MVSERAATESRESAEAIERMKSEAASFAPPLPHLPESEPRPAFPSRPHSHARSSDLRHIRRQLRAPQPVRSCSPPFMDRPCRHSDRRPCSVSMMVLLVLVLGLQLDKALKEQMHLEGELIKTKMMAAESEENYLQTKTLYSLSVLSTFS